MREKYQKYPKSTCKFQTKSTFMITDPSHPGTVLRWLPHLDLMQESRERMLTTNYWRKWLSGSGGVQYTQITDTVIFVEYWYLSEGSPSPFWVDKRRYGVLQLEASAPDGQSPQQGLSSGEIYRFIANNMELFCFGHKRQIKLIIFRGWGIF